MKQDYTIRNSAELEALLGSPNDVVKQKMVDRLDDVMVGFIARSPLVFIATSDESGLPDISPKGDAPGFVMVDEAGRLLIPERLGNKLMLGFNNLLRNNSIGLIFVIPDTRETLRVKGRATLSRDPDLLKTLSAQEKPALLCTTVEVTECFFHCGKAMIRSKLWKSESWKKDEHFMAKHFSKRNKTDEEKITSNLEAAYKDNLY